MVAKEYNFERHTGIELLKIFAIFLIITNHVVQTLSSPNEYVFNNGYIIDISLATDNIKYIILAMLRYSGVLGNNLFFISSAWFLLDKKVSDKKKLYFIMADVWIISVLFLISAFVTNHGSISAKLIIKSLFPITFSNNWYVTCYILFCLLYPFLNMIIYKMTHIQLFRTSILLALLYIFMNYIKDKLFFSSALILWVSIYFIVAYMKIYMLQILNSLKVNIIMLMIGMVGNYGSIFLINILGGGKNNFFSDKLIYWCDRNCNPFLILASIALINIVLRWNKKIKLINDISKCSLLIYVIHENLIVRTYYRPEIWRYIYNKYGYAS